MATESVNIVFTALDRTGTAFRSLRGNLNGLGDQVTSVRGLIGTLTAGFGAGAFVAGIKAASEAADAAAKMGDRFGIATEKVIGLKHAGELAGASSGAIAAGLKNLANVSVEAARGGEEAARAFAMLDLSAAAFIKLPMDEQLTVVIEKLGKVENATLRNELANKMLGKSYGELMGLVAEGADALREAQRDAEAWGLAINRVDAAKLEMANDAITRAKAAAQGLFTTIAVHVAPVVKMLADRFSDASIEANGFRSQVSSSMESVAKAVGTAIFFVERLQFAYAAVKVAVAAMGAVGLEVFKFILEQIEKVARIASYLPGPFGLAGKVMSQLAKEGVAGLGEMADVAHNRFAELKLELDNITENSSTLEQWRDRVLTAFRTAAADMQKQAEKIAEARKTMQGGSDLELEKDKDKDDKNKDQWKERLAAQLERVREANMSEMELLREKHREANEIIQQSLEAGIITEEEALNRSAAQRAKFEKESTRITDEETKRRYGIANVYRSLDLNSAKFFFDLMGGMMASKSRTMFEIGKAGAITGAIIDTYKAATGAYASLASIPIVGPALGAAAAAAAIVAGMARVQQIRSTQFGGSGTGGSGAAAPTFNANPNTGVPTAPIVPQIESIQRNAQESVERNVSITFVGGSSKQYSYTEIAEEIIPLINEAVGNGVNIRVSTSG